MFRRNAKRRNRHTGDNCSTDIVDDLICVIFLFPALQNLISTRNKYYKKENQPLYHSCYSHHIHRTDNCLVALTTNLMMYCVTKVNLSQSNGGELHTLLLTVPESSGHTARIPVRVGVNDYNAVKIFPLPLIRVLTHLQ